MKAVYKPGMVIKGATLIKRVNKKTRFGGFRRSWLVRYPWGQEKVVSSSYLPLMREFLEIDQHADLFVVFRHYKLAARKRGYSFNLSREEVLKIVKQDCHYCGKAPSNKQKSLKKGQEPFLYNGMDRRDNSQGYTLENVVPCCGFCNRLKSNLLTEEETKAAVEAIRQVRASTQIG